MLRIANAAAATGKTILAPFFVPNGPAGMQHKFESLRLLPPKILREWQRPTEEETGQQLYHQMEELNEKIFSRLHDTGAPRDISHKEGAELLAYLCSFNDDPRPVMDDHVRCMRPQLVIADENRDMYEMFKNTIKKHLHKTIHNGVVPFCHGICPVDAIQGLILATCLIVAWTWDRLSIAREPKFDQLRDPSDFFVREFPLCAFASCTVEKSHVNLLLLCSRKSAEMGSAGLHVLLLLIAAVQVGRFSQSVNTIKLKSLVTPISFYQKFGFEYADKNYLFRRGQKASDGVAMQLKNVDKWTMPESLQKYQRVWLYCLHHARGQATPPPNNDVANLFHLAKTARKGPNVLTRHVSLP